MNNSIFVKIAVDTIQHYCKKKERVDYSSFDTSNYSELNAKLACFVSIHDKDGGLRGCIGTIEPAKDCLLNEIIEVGYKKDDYAIKNILQQNSKELYRSIKKHHITACGYGPIMALIEYAKLQTTNSEMKILKRGHSGEIIPSKEVVNYISFLSFSTNDH